MPVATFERFFTASTIVGKDTSIRKHDVEFSDKDTHICDPEGQKHRGDDSLLGDWVSRYGIPNPPWNERREERQKKVAFANLISAIDDTCWASRTPTAS